MAVSDADVKAWFAANPNASDKEIAEAAKAADVSAAQIALATKANVADVIDRAKATGVDIRSGMISGNDIAAAGGIDAYRAQTTGTGPTSGDTTSLNPAPTTPMTFTPQDYDAYMKNVGTIVGSGALTQEQAFTNVAKEAQRLRDQGYTIDDAELARSVNAQFGTNFTASDVGQFVTDVNTGASDTPPPVVTPPLVGTGGTGGGTNFVPTDPSKNPYVEFLENRALSTTLPEGTEVTTEKIGSATDEQLLSYSKLGDITPVTAEEAGEPDEVVTPLKPLAGEYDITATTTEGKVPTATEAQLTPEEISAGVRLGQIQGELSPEAIASAAQAKVMEEQLVSFQLGELYKSIQEGRELPAWAAGSARAATQVMQQRGLGTSSMAAAAVSQAVLEAGLPIAAADAAEYSKINVANLNNRQQAVLQNAAATAQMDMANLDARMKAAVQNSQNFLAIDLQNLSNEQATETLNYQGQLQSLFTDVAAENAASQFNAKTQQQVDEFFAELGVQVDNANSNRVAAMEQFNVDQVNSIAEFNASMEDARDRFDATMQTQIDQSNAQWRREIATIDTATENEINRQNAMNLLQTSQSAISALWQRYRDESAWLMQSTENQKARAHQLAMLEFEKNANVDMFGLESEYATASAVGNATLAGILGVVIPNED